MGLARERGTNGRLLVDAWMSLNECLPGPASEAHRQANAAGRAAMRRRADAYDRFQAGFRQRLREADPALEGRSL